MEKLRPRDLGDGRQQTATRQQGSDRWLGLSWIQIRIRIGNANPDRDQGVMTLIFYKKKNHSQSFKTAFVFMYKGTLCFITT
jgi:hypothetical protein